jgi:hypothetical protein
MFLIYVLLPQNITVMKKVLFSLMCLCSVFQLVAQSSGGLYTLQDLATLLPNAIQVTSPNHYRILQNVTLESPDTLLLQTTDEHIIVDGGKEINIMGTLLTQERTTPLLIQGDFTQNDYFEIYFESTSLSTLKNVHVQYCQHIKLINSQIHIESCEFDHFSDHVISYLNCDPVIENSYFHDNQACAIQSAINTDGCPKILNNVFYNNVLANTNNPQINIGPGTTDTIFIVGNRIEGVSSTMSGGIGISNLTNPAITKVVVRDNIITHNRYGYTQNGYRISSLIADNQFIENDLEVNPNNGGSGISIYGYDTTCAAKLRHNLITGNLWGITAIYYHHVDMGTEDDYGYNILYNNGNGGVEYELYNNASSNMNAVGNYWGCDNEAAAEAVIFHQVDNASYGLVNYQPIYLVEPEITRFDLLMENNPEALYYYGDMYGEITADDTILFYVGCVVPDLTHIYPTITKPFWVTVTPDETEAQDFLGDWENNSVLYVAATPHQSTRTYVVRVNIEGAVPENELTKINLAPNPVTQGYFQLENPTGEEFAWTMLSVDGKAVMSGVATPGNQIISTKHLQKGMYLITFQQNRQFLTKKLIVQ